MFIDSKNPPSSLFSDMINMMQLGFVPECVEWIYSAGDPISAVAVSDQESNKIYIYDGQGSETPIHIFDKLHTKPVVALKVNKRVFLMI